MKRTIQKQVLLGDHHRKKSRTTHLVAGSEVDRPTVLQLVTFDGAQGCYLIALSPDGRELTDTYHDNIELAQDQAHFEFDVADGDWVDFSHSTDIPQSESPAFIQRIKDQLNRGSADSVDKHDA